MIYGLVAATGAWPGRAIGVACIVAAVGMQGLGQVCFKWAAVRGAGGGPRGWRGTPGRVAGLGLFCYFVQGIFWTLALRHLDLSIAFPLGSLSFVAVAVLSAAILGEVVGGKRWVGIALILAGATLLGTAR